MPRYAIFFIFLVISCSQAYIEETQDIVNIPIATSYDISTDGILVEWESQWDYASTDVYRGTSAYSLKVHKSDVSTSTLMDYDVAPGTEYYYQIRAYNSKGRNIGVSAVSKGYRSYRSIDVVVQPTDLRAAEDLTSDSIKFYWTGSVSDSFRIYRKKGTVSDNNDVRLSDFELYDVANFDFNDNIVYIDTNVELGATYSYVVTAVGQDANKNISQKCTDYSISSTTKESPTGVVASYRDPIISDSIRISWDRKIGDEYYSVYRATSEDGEYILISTFINETTYIDRALPDTAGFGSGSDYDYPTYYYKVTSGSDSGYSAAAEGQAVASADLLSPPNDFIAQFDNSDFSLNLSWDIPDNVNGKSYYFQLISYDDNDVTNILLGNTTATTYSLDLSAEDENTYSSFGKYYTYEIVTVNESINIAGVPSKTSYTHNTLGASTITNISFDDIDVVTNTTVVSTPVIVYYGNDSDSVGQITEEWYTVSTANSIIVKWQKYHQLEQVSHFELYRRVQGSDDEFKLIAEVNDTEYKDSDFTTEELKQTHEYKVIAVNFLGSQAPESAVYSDFMLPAPSYVNIPAHWARKKKGSGGFANGFTRYSEIAFSSTWAVGSDSPEGADKIQGLNGNGGGQHLYLVWDDVVGANYYTATVNNQDIDGYTSSANTYTVVDNASGDGKTGFYSFTSGGTFSNASDTSETEATFSVTPVSATGIVGESRGIVFEQVKWVE